MSSILTDLKDDLLYLFVFGPGFGETTLIRIPPDIWIVVDSFRDDDEAAGNVVLKEWSKAADLLIFTHPHDDHCAGFIDLIEASPNARIGCLHPFESTFLDEVSNDPLDMFSAMAKRTYDRVRQEWSQDPSKRWLTKRSAEHRFPDAIVRSLHPKSPTNMHQWAQQHVNDLSTAMTLEWGDVCILLGADVTNEHGCWEDIYAAYSSIGDHAALKVPHHGSNPALHACFGNGSRDRCWIITPYSKGRKLPRFDTNEGIEHALSFVDEVSLTSLPYRHDSEANAPIATTRNSILSGSPARIETHEACEKMERGVVIGFAKDGTIVERRYGQGTLRVVE